MNKGSHILVILLVTMLLSSCREKPPFQEPEELLSEETYLFLFYELELLRIYQNQGIPSSITDSIYTTIFKKYKVEPDLFDSTHQYFQTQIDLQQIRTDTVISWLQKDLNRISELDSLLTAQESLTKE